MTRPNEVDDYDAQTKKEAEMHEQKVVDIEFGETSKLTPDIARPTYIFHKREDSICRVLR